MCIWLLSRLAGESFGILLFHVGIAFLANDSVRLFFLIDQINSFQGQNIGTMCYFRRGLPIEWRRLSLRRSLSRRTSQTPPRHPQVPDGPRHPRKDPCWSLQRGLWSPQKTSTNITTRQKAVQNRNPPARYLLYRLSQSRVGCVSRTIDSHNYSMF